MARDLWDAQTLAACGLLLIESRLGVPLKRVSMFVHPLFQLAAA